MPIWKRLIDGMCRLHITSAIVGQYGLDPAWAFAIVHQMRNLATDYRPPIVRGDGEIIQ